MNADAHIQHINVNVDDLGVAVAFYRDVLGLALDPTPDQGFQSQFFRINARQQIHMNVCRRCRPLRAHFCVRGSGLSALPAQAAGAIDLAPWGRVRALPSGKMQMFVRDPHGNLIEIASVSGAVIDPALFKDDLVEPKPGVYRMAPGASVGRHETA